MKPRKRWLWLLILLPITLLAVGLVWALTPLGPMLEAEESLKSTASVQVISDQWIVYKPVSEPKNTGLIIYPGGRVDSRSYSPTAMQISSSGYYVVIVPMPLNLAVIGANEAKTVIEAFPEIQKWIVSGHSLGGTMAARFVNQNPDIVDGLILMAAYPAANDDLSTIDISSLSIFSTLDGLTTLEDIDGARHLLPQDSIYVEIDGGNHAQFGWYGDQPGDNPATISRETQQDLTNEAILALLEQINE